MGKALSAHTHGKIECDLQTQGWVHGKRTTDVKIVPQLNHDLSVSQSHESRMTDEREITGFYPSPKSFWSCTHVNSCQKYLLYINLHILLNILSKTTLNIRESRKFIKFLKR